MSRALGRAVGSATAVASVVALLAWAPLAAASTMSDAYWHQVAAPVSAVKRVSPTRVLPFTGMDVAVLLLAAAGLILLGIGVRRLWSHVD